MAYLVAFLKTLPTDGAAPSSQIEVTNYAQLDQPDLMTNNYNEIGKLSDLHHEHPYVYGTGRAH